jgi:leucine-zipper of insertion element IS481
MKLHANAALSLTHRRRMVGLVVEDGWSIKNAAAEFKTSTRTCSKWVARYRAASESGLLDRSSACHVLANRTDERRIEAIAALRRLRFTGPEIAELLDMPVSTVSGILTRIGMGRLGRLGLEAAQRYERARPGELIHVDVKSSGGSLAAPGTASPARARGAMPPAASPTPRGVGAARPAGSSCTSRSMTPPGWPTPRSSAMRRPAPRPDSYAAPCGSTPATASPCSA